MTNDRSDTIRTRILVATLELVAQHGVDAVTHRAVAGRAGVSPGSTTHHFSSREDLLREAFRLYLRGAERVVGDLLERADADANPVDRLRRQLVAVVDREFAVGLVRAEYELLLHACGDPELAAELRAWEARVVAAVAAALEAAGAVRPMTGARAVVNLFRGYELERLIDPGLTTADFEERLGMVLVSLIAAAR